MQRPPRSGLASLTIVASAALVLAAILVVPFVRDGGASREPGPSFLERGDLPAIREHGRLRILLPRREGFRYLPRHGVPLDFERELAAGYARRVGLEPEWVFVENRDRLIPDLLEGKGDIVAANLTATAERREVVEFSVPVAIVREQLVARPGDAPRDEDELAGRTVAVRRSSSFWDTVQALRRRQPGLRVKTLDESMETEEAIDGVAAGDLDLTVADSNLLDAVLQYRGDVVAALDLTPDRPIAWAVRPNADALLESLDRYLTQAQLTARRDEPRTDDLDGIAERRLLRLITRNTPATYFLWRGQLMGFEYELVRAFAHDQGLRMEVIVPPPDEDPLDWLRDGRGDIVSASLTPFEGARAEGVEFVRPYHFVSHVVVARADDDSIATPADLAGRTVHVHADSAYVGTLAALQAAGIDVHVELVTESLSTEQLIARVADGTYDLTVSDSHIVAIETSWRDDVRVALALQEDIPLAWAVRASNPLLHQAADEYIGREYRGLTYNVLHDRYFGDEERTRRHVEERVATTGGISPYDDLVKRYADRYGFDWRLIVAVMFEESRFRPEARSFAGAEGLMQILPTTALEMGFDDVIDPESAIHAGVRYLDWIRDRFEPSLSVRDRMWFSLAAYNAGTGHVSEARRLARRLGLDPNRWFDNVEQAMLLLSRPEYASQSRYGYCRCTEPVEYVRDIRDRYNAYVQTLGS